MPGRLDSGWPRLIVVLAAIAAVALTLAQLDPARGQGGGGHAPGHRQAHEDYHPQWLRDSGCCGPADCYRARVRYTPAGWQVLALRLRPTDPWRPPARPITIPADKAQPSRDGHFWVCLFLGGDRKGQVRSHGAPPRLCFFQPVSGQ